MIKIHSLTVYPVKSLGPVEVDSTDLEPRGLRYDRRWMVIDDQAMFVTQRTLEAMALIKVEITTDGLRLSREGFGQVAIPFKPEGNPITVQVWNSVVEAQTVLTQADQWLSDCLKRSLRLVYMPDHSQRESGKSGQSIVSFADGYPVLVVSLGSLDLLNQKLGETHTVSMRRFRPNIVLEGVEAHHEDTVATLETDSASLIFEKQCARCKVVTIDPETSAIGKEPLKTLATYRTQNGQVMFGANYRPGRCGPLYVGQTVTALYGIAQ
jgi:hypothetical protein